MAGFLDYLIAPLGLLILVEDRQTLLIPQELQPPDLLAVEVRVLLAVLVVVDQADFAARDLPEPDCSQG